MAINTVAKGNRHVQKTIKWLEAQGFVATKCEYRTKWCTYDLWGADVVARNCAKLVFIQVKANRGHMAQGVKELTKDDKWPLFVSRWVVHWPERAKEPEVRVVGVQDTLCKSRRGHVQSDRAGKHDRRDDGFVGENVQGQDKV